MTHEQMPAYRGMREYQNIQQLHIQYSKMKDT